MNTSRFVLCCVLAGCIVTQAGIGPANAAAPALVATEHVVDVRLDRGVATLTVQRSWRNDGLQPVELSVEVVHPESAVATALRVRPEASSRWQAAAWTAAGATAQRPAPAAPGRIAPALATALAWGGAPGRLSLRLGPLPAGQAAAVEYTLMMPAPYRGGTDRLTLPALGQADAPAVVRVHAEPTHAVVVNGLSAGSGAMLQTPSDDDDETQWPLSIRARSASRTPLSIRLADVPLRSGRSLLRAELVASPQLGAVPARPAIAIVLDTSRSMVTRWDALRAAADGYLAFCAPASVVTVLAFNRQVSMPFGAAQTPAQARAALRGYQPTFGNGSALDQALREADRVLLTSGRSTRRMLVLSDLGLRAGLDADRIARIPLRSGAIVHVARPQPGNGWVTRNDDTPWAALARQTGGVLWEAGADSDPKEFEQWVRPTQLDRIRVTGLADFHLDPASLAEGESIVHEVMADRASPRLAWRAELWSREVAGSAASNHELERRAARLVFGDGLIDETTEPERRALAELGAVVSATSSLVAVAPTTPTPTVARVLLQDAPIAHENFACNHPFEFGAAEIPRPLDMQQAGGWLRAAVRRAWRSCGGSGTLGLEVETTGIEIVDVGQLRAEPPNAAVSACVEAAVWSMALPEPFDARPADNVRWNVAVQ